MKQISAAYASKLAIGIELARHSARAITITSAARLKASDARAIYRQVNGRGSNPGNTPYDPQWFLSNKIKRQHSALLLLLYCKYRTNLELSDAKHDAHGLALALAFRVYSKVTNDTPVINLNRLNFLIGKGFCIGWRDIIKGGSSKFELDNVKVITCKVCKIPHLAEAHFVNYVCAECQAH
jgi:hypothetical protein